jgi:putative ABC transport system permease protein
LGEIRQDQLMSPLIRQIIAVTKINLLSLPQRLWMSLSAVIAIAFVVIVLLGALALQNGFAQAQNSSGSEDVAIILREGSSGGEINSVITREQQQLLEAGPGIAKGANGKPLVSNELYIIVDGMKRSTQTKANLPLRGLSLEAINARKGVKISQGRMFSPGSNEIVVGSGILKQFDGFVLGQTKRLGTNNWKVVGVFDAGGSAFESEMWADLGVVQSLFNRGSTVQSVRVRLTSPAALQTLKNYAKADSRLKVDVQSEQEFYADQAEQGSQLITYVGIPLAVIMAFGALAGALNTMYASVASRTGEIATLRTIGFGGFPTFVGTLIESFVLALIGALVGAIIAYIAFNGMTASTMNGASFTQIVFNVSLSAPQLIQGTIWASVLGFLGGVFPAIRAARQPILSATAE